MPADPKRIQAVFLAAVDTADPADRVAVLDRECGSDAELRLRIEALLKAHDAPASVLDGPALVAAPTDTQAEAADAAEDEQGLDCLEPSTRPDALGRLGHYEVLQVLGRGGFGIVFRAFDDVLQRVVALKVMAPQLAATSPARKRFLREARTSAQVRHENVVQVYEVGEQPLPYLAMEFIPGETLQNKLDRSGPIEVSEVVRIGRQIAEGLAAAHACDLIHRDIKPANILLEGGSHKAKLTDFGLARAADDASISQSGVIAGTPMFMAPEQALGQKIDQRADLFSLGSVLYQMASGRPPFRAPTALAVLKRVAEEPPRPIPEIIPETPEWLCAIIAKLHAKNPAERFQSAREVADLLADCEAKLKAKQAVNDVLPAAVKPARRKRSAAPVPVLFFLLACVVVGYQFGKDIAAMLRPGPPPAQPPRPLDNPPSYGEPGPRLLGVVPKDDFVPLFNRKDLTGWKTHPQQPGEWTVENGILVGHAGPRSHLYTERGDLHNFELRCEVKLNANANSGITIRTPFAMREPDTPLTSTPAGYEVQLCEGKRLDGARQHLSGAIIGVTNTPKENLIVANLWHTVVIKARDDQFETYIDDVQTLAVSDPQRRWQGGHIALQVYTPGTRVEFRKIEIKVLPPAEPGWVQLFNGKDLDGWTPHENKPNGWKVENGLLIGRSPESYLYGKDVRNKPIHLRAVTRINDGGAGALILHTSAGTSQGCWAAINGTHPSRKTGHLHGTFVNFMTDPGPGKVTPPRPGEWFTLDVLSRNGRVVVKVNDVVSSEIDIGGRFGGTDQVALYVGGEKSVVEFKSIQIMELPATGTPSLAVAPFDSKKAKEHQDAWAKHLGIEPEFTNSIGMKLRLIPPGTFQMGSPDKEPERDPREGPRHEVTLTRPFGLGAHAVTVGQFRAFVKDTNYETQAEKGDGADRKFELAWLRVRGANWKNPGFAQTDDHPVVCVSWKDASAFCEWLSKKEVKQYVLPTEAQWEYACRAGSQTKFSFGNDDEELGEHAWHHGNADEKTHPIGKKSANAWGLHDMHGNVNQWLADWFDWEYYKKSPKVDPTGGTGDQRVCRGGSWNNSPGQCRAAYRISDAPSYRSTLLGFRVALVGDLRSPAAK